jgi:hypothetical protein
VEEAIFDALTRGREGTYELSEAGATKVAAALEHAMSTEAADSAVRELIALAGALRLRHGSPAAARELLAIVRANPRARALVAAEVSKRDAARHRAKRFEKTVMGAGPMRAPSVEPTNTTGLQVKDLLDPLARERRPSSASRMQRPRKDR